MNPIVRPGQVASVKIKDLRKSKAHTSLYQEWLKQGNSGSFDNFMAALRPPADEAWVRRIVENVLSARASAVLPDPDTVPVAPPAADPAPTVPPAAALNRKEIEEIVRGLMPAAQAAASIADQIKGLMDAADFEFSDGLKIKPGRALSVQEFNDWKATVTAGQTVVQAAGQVLVLNDWFAPEMQADVLLRKPQMQHSRAIYDILKERLKPGMKVRMFGNFNMAKLSGIEPELWGEDGRTAAPALAAGINGCQPTMILRFDNNDIDFSQCRFIVQNMMTDGYAVAGYKGHNRFKPGQWITKTVDEHDPDRRAAQDWTALGGKNGVFPPIDGTTGFAAKGYADAGFNSTNCHADCGNYRSNSLDTSGLTTGGYGGRFPQADGSTAATWGTWKDGGLIGNMGSGGIIFQTPEVGKAERETASVVVEGHYARGFITYGIEVGIHAKPNGDSFRSLEEIWEYVPQNVWLIHTQVEDCYEGGLQANRFVNLWELYSRCYRMGHPDSGFTYHKPNHPQSATINDPGYGSSSRRETPQINRYIIGCWYIDCARKGIDAHKLAGLFVAKVRIKSKIWGIQICCDEIYTKAYGDRQEAYLASQVTIRDSEIFAGIKGLDFTNGSFSSRIHTNPAKQRLYEMRFNVMAENLQIFAPIGVFDNYSRGGYTLRNVSCTCAYPYGKLPHFNPASSRGFWLGAQDPAGRGIPFNIRLEGCTAQNSPSGNYADAFMLQPANLLPLRDCIADITPFISDSVMPNKYLRGRDVVRSGIKTVPFAVPSVAGVKVQNAQFDNCVAVDKTSGEPVVARFEYRDEPAAAVVAPPDPAITATAATTQTEPVSPGPAEPKALPQVLRFGMAAATSTMVQDDSGAVTIEMAGSHPPANWSDMADVSGDIKFIKGRLKDRVSSTAGVYPRIRVDLDRVKDSTIVMPVRIHSVGRSAAVISLAATPYKDDATSLGFIVDKKADTNQLAIRNMSRYKVEVNGEVNNAETRLDYGQWAILVYKGKIGGEYLNLGTRHDGNGQLDADYGAGLTVFRNHTPNPDDLAALINELKGQYGI
ncbi:hypothetical protein ACFPVS_13435 [Neisseria weixii]|uniref:hypothetical protein n=1 Tax=Neisseria weixii TaxID=1853276 RepID=UPI000BB84E07|nr:hypothetical protein [Neisseria weixii]ATD64895.1 hypothetical protein CGZ65_05415 [Neisseria weixii]